MPKTVRTGSCICGSVRYTITGEMGAAGACHCSMCRKQSGHFISGAKVPEGGLEFSSEEGLRWYRSSDWAERGFCANCGSSLFYRLTDGSATIAMLGAIDNPTGLKLTGHIFVGEKGDYYEITDGLPQKQTM